MWLCEVCGAKEEIEETINEEEVMQAFTLHICESCREDRKYLD